MTPDSTPQEEIERFEEQYRKQPESLVFARLADALRKAGEAGRALQVLEDGLGRHPDYASGHIVHARALRDLGRLEEAAESFRRVLELDAGNLVAVRELGSLAEERQELEEARHWYERLVQVDPANEDAARRLDEIRDTLAGLEDAGPAEDAAPGAPPPSTASAEGEPAGAPADPAAGSPSDEESGSEWWNDPVDLGRSDAEEKAALADEEVVEAILNGDVPRTIRAEESWWYEERDDEEAPEPSAEADLLTRTMADLYAEQGLVKEAREIYVELLRDSPDDVELRSRLAAIDERMAGRTPQAEAVELPDAEPDVPDAADEPEPGDELPEPARPRGPPVVDELRRILRRGEEKAATLPEPGEGEPPVRPDASDEPGPPLSDFTRRWLADLEGGG